MRRLGVLVAVLVLGAWTCQAPVDHGGVEPMAGPTTTGLAALQAGEGWRYVGEAGEPAFAHGWTNYGADQLLAFRIREAGVVDIIGVVAPGTLTDYIFQLPAGYWPSSDAFYLGIGNNAAGTAAWPITVNVVGGGGEVGISANGSTPDRVYLSGQFFLDPPT